MNRFEEQWLAAVGAVRDASAAGRLPPEAAERIAPLAARLHFPGQLILLATAPTNGHGPVGDELLSGASALGAKQSELRAAGIDAETIEQGLRALLLEHRAPTELLRDERLQAAALEAAGRFLASRGVPITPTEAKTALRLITSGESFRDIGAATSVIAHAVPALPLAIGRDVPRAPWIVIGRLVPAILLDVPGLPFEVAKVIGTTLLDGSLGEAPSPLPRTIRVLYELSSLRTIAETLRALIGRDNESFRLALILYARAHGVPLDESQLDVLHDSVLNTDAPDLGPALVAAVKAYADQGKLGKLRQVLERFQLPPEGDADRGRSRRLADTIVAAEPEPETRFEGVVFRRKADATESPAAIVARVLGPGWRCGPFSPSTPNDYEAVPLRAVTLGEGWEATHRLAADAQVERAEPRIETHAPDEPEARARGAIFGRPVDPATGDHKWSPKLVRAFDAWALEPPLGGERFGDGVIVGHPDTGYTAHAELEGRIVAGYDFVDDDADPTDPLIGGAFWRFPGHGTGTASVLASPDEPDADGRMTGVAPAAHVMPLRVSTSVVHLSLANVTKAIYYAVDHGCQVISMSLGGPFGFGYCHDSVRYAVERGVIVVAAAGNEVGFVTYPAAFPEAVAVSGCDVGRRPWRGSSHGPAVDIGAPAADVWKASIDGAPPHVGQSSGTSFATASVAGVAALWLAYHGRDRLIAKYGAAGVPRVFVALLQRTCQPGVDWPAGEYGPGIVDAKKLLEADLPPAPPAPRAARAPLAAEGAVVVLAHHFPGSTENDVRTALAAVLGVRAEEVDAKLRDTGLELPMHIVLDRDLHAAFRAALDSGRARGLPPAGAVRSPLRDRLRARASSKLSQQL